MKATIYYTTHYVVCKIKHCWAFLWISNYITPKTIVQKLPEKQTWLVLDSDRSSKVETHNKRLKYTGKFRSGTCNNYMRPLNWSKATKQTFNELNLHHIGKHPYRCFHSKINSAVSGRKNSQKERSNNRLAGKINNIYLFPSVREGEHWLCRWTTDRNR